MNDVKGFKVFNPDWTCRGKKYTCPGKFEEDVKIEICQCGMHFCKKAIDCFNYYKFSPENKIAEVVAYGEIQKDGDKCCTNKLEIVREVSWHELLEIINTGHGCTGCGNSGDRNSGDFNSGDRNSGDRNSGDFNSGNRNSGNFNSGDFNSGDFNSGNRNSGDFNSGDRNSGDFNSGNRNSGNFNSGDFNSGDFNTANYSNGCFNTIEPKIYLFNKPSNWTYKDWMYSKARDIISGMPNLFLQWISLDQMDGKGKTEHPESHIAGGYLKRSNETCNLQKWWDNLTNEEQIEVMSIPNFDKEIFKKVTGIDIDG